MSDKSPTYSDLIDAPALQSLQPAPALLDCRARLGDANWGREQYLASHIPGALHADLDAHLAAPPDARGRHPLPHRATWVEQIRAYGIRNDQQVVVYDDAGGAYAARAWWMLRWVGHSAVAVLDGGLQHWPGSLTTEVNQPARSNFTPAEPLTRIATTAEVVAGLTDPHAPRLLDARALERYAGDNEPIDPVAGHIPGAVCSPFTANLNADGQFKTATDLAAKFEPFMDQDLICYCGSGVTAAHNILALHVCGRDDVALYPESWSGWITDPSRPVETGLQ